MEFDSLTQIVRIIFISGPGKSWVIDTDQFARRCGDADKKLVLVPFFPKIRVLKEVVAQDVVRLSPDLLL